MSVWLGITHVSCPERDMLGNTSTWSLKMFQKSKYCDLATSNYIKGSVISKHSVSKLCNLAAKHIMLIIRSNEIAINVVSTLAKITGYCCNHNSLDTCPNWSYFLRPLTPAPKTDPSHSGSTCTLPSCLASHPAASLLSPSI